MCVRADGPDVEFLRQYRCRDSENTTYLHARCVKNYSRESENMLESYWMNDSIRLPYSSHVCLMRHTGPPGILKWGPLPTSCLRLILWKLNSVFKRSPHPNRSCSLWYKVNVLVKIILLIWIINSNYYEMISTGISIKNSCWVFIPILKKGLQKNSPDKNIFISEKYFYCLNWKTQIFWFIWEWFGAFAKTL